LRIFSIGWKIAYGQKSSPAPAAAASISWQSFHLATFNVNCFMTTRAAGKTKSDKRKKKKDWHAEKNRRR